MKKILLAVALLISLVGCADVETEATQEDVIDEFETYSESQGMGKINIIIDKTTGVEYIFVESGNRGGLSPRYNADGSLKINEEWSGVDE